MKWNTAKFCFVWQCLSALRFRQAHNLYRIVKRIPFLIQLVVVRIGSIRRFPTIPGIALVVPSTANHIATQRFRLQRVLYNLRYACSGRDNKQSYQIRYSAEKAIQDILRQRPRVAIHPICILSAIQDQRPLDPGSNKLDTVCGKPSRNLVTACRQCACWRVCRLLWDDSDQHNQFEVQYLSVQPKVITPWTSMPTRLEDTRSTSW